MMKISASFPPWDGRPCLRRLRIRRCRPGHFWSAAAPRPRPNKFGVGGASAVLCRWTCFKSSLAKNLYYKAMHVQQLFLAVVWVEISEKQLLSNQHTIMDVRRGMSPDFGYR